jgi:titin
MVLIDGYSQPGTSVNTNNDSEGINTHLLIEINGSNYTVGDGIATGAGLRFGPGSSGSFVQGLVINEWLLAGIFIDGTLITLNDIAILGNFIGTNVDGTQQLANAIGILAINADQIVIGGNGPSRNLIAGSFSFFLGGSCISLADCLNVPILFNLIGTDRTGTQALGNSINGLFIDASEEIFVIANVISGHAIYGVQFSGVTNSVIADNAIGTDIFGAIPLGNLNAGIELDGISGPTTNVLVAENLISGNGTGIRLGQTDDFGSSGNVIAGNFIGTDETGLNPLGNREDGLWIVASDNVIGGTEYFEKNLISSNGRNGILISSQAEDNLVLGNLIGVDATGEHALGNGDNGIQLGAAGGFNAALSNVIGGTVSGAGNVISGNANDGILITAFTERSIIQGNLIGTDATGAQPIPNGNDGIEILNSSQNLIGGDSLEAGNVIAFNHGAGVSVGANAEDSASIGNVILTNSIFANKSLGIDLHIPPALPFPFPQHYETQGPNHFQRSPKLRSASSNAVATGVDGELKSAKNQTYLIQFFSNPNSRKGQGKVFLGETVVATNSKGIAKFTTYVNPVDSGDSISATATLLDALETPVETSEFSNLVKVGH